MIDTLAIARALTDADLTPAQADAITDAVRQAAEQSVDVDALATKADLAHFATKADLTALEARIYRAMLVQAAIVGALVGIAGMVLGALRLLGSGS